MSLQYDGALTAGLNPFVGLFKYPSATLVLFAVFLIIIFTSVKSSVFERKKSGIGLEIKDKEEKGYNRWAKEKEYKEDKDVEMVNPLDSEIKAAGIPLINDGKHLWVDNGEYHNLVIGSTGSGKSQTIVEPMVELLIKKGESMIITDPKAEIYISSGDYLKERGYKVVILNFRDPQKGNAWNPLSLPYKYYQEGNKDKSTELLDDVALNILYDPNNKGEPFWEKSAADYFSGLALGLFEDAKEEEMNLNSINYMSTVGEEKLGGTNTYIKEYFTQKGESSNAYVFASNTINAPQDTKGSILSVFRQKIRGFASRENLSEMLSHSDFDIRDIGKEKTAVFICIHDEKTTYHGLATIFIKQVYETLIDVAQANGGKLPFRTNFILDEFANMPPLKDVGTMVTAARSRDIRFTFIIQNFAQLKGVYGAEIAETIRGNCGNLVYLISTELAALEEISKMCGEVKSKDDEKTSSTPLVTVTDLQKLKLFQAIIIRWRLSPLKVNYTPNFKMNWGHEKSHSAFPQREEQQIQLFDVKTFVKNKKTEKVLNSIGDNKNNSMGGFNNPPGGMYGNPSPFGSSPFGGPSSFNNPSPFGSSSSFNNPSPFGSSNSFNNPSPFGSSNSFNNPSPFGGSNSFNNPSPFGSPPSAFDKSSPFASQPSIGVQNDNTGALGGLTNNKIDFDAMMRDIDKKIAELDAEEARQKEELAKKKKEAAEIDAKLNALPDKAEVDIDTKVQNPIPDVNIDAKIDNPIPDVNIDAKIDNPIPDVNIDAKFAKPKFDINVDTKKDNYIYDIESDSTINTSLPGVNPEFKTSSSPSDIKLDFNLSSNKTKEIKDVDISVENNIELPKVSTKDSSSNISITTKVDTPNYESLDEPKIKIDTATPNVAIATKSPIDEDDFSLDDSLPEAQNADLINPAYLNEAPIKVDSSLENTNMNEIVHDYDNKEEVKATITPQESTPSEADALKQRIQTNITRMENEGKIEVNTTKANVNIDADSIEVKNNSVITDDEFFDDFFGDD